MASDIAQQIRDLRVLLTRSEIFSFYLNCREAMCPIRVRQQMHIGNSFVVQLTRLGSEHLNAAPLWKIIGGHERLE